jgi:hypothetical protein
MLGCGRSQLKAFISMCLIWNVGCSRGSDLNWNDILGKKSKKESSESRVNQDSGALSLAAGQGMLKQPDDVLEIQITDSKGKTFSAILKPGSSSTQISGLAVGKATARATLKNGDRIIKEGTGETQISSHRPAYLALYLRVVGGDGSVVIDVIDYPEDPVCAYADSHEGSAGSAADKPVSSEGSTMISPARPPKDFCPPPVPYPCYNGVNPDTISADPSFVKGRPAPGCVEPYPNPSASFFNLSLPAGEWKTTFGEHSGYTLPEESYHKSLEVHFNPRNSDNKPAPAVQSVKITRKSCKGFKPECVQKEVVLMDEGQLHSVVVILNSVEKPMGPIPEIGCPVDGSSLSITLGDQVFTEDYNCPAYHHFNQKSMLQAWKSIDSFLH